MRSALGDGFVHPLAPHVCIGAGDGAEVGEVALMSPAETELTGDPNA